MKKPIEILYDCMGDGAHINIYANKFRGDDLMSSKLLCVMTVEAADELVKKLSAEIHRDTRLVKTLGGLQ